MKQETHEEGLIFPIMIENGLDYLRLSRKIFDKGVKWQREQDKNKYSEEEVNKMFDTLKRNSINNVATITNVDLFISSWKREMKNI